MNNLAYKLIDVKDKKQFENLTDKALEDIERPDFFIRFTDDDIKSMFDTTKTLAYGAYDGDKLIATAQLYIYDDYVKEVKKLIDFKEQKLAEVGGYMTLPDYRGKGIMKDLQSILIDEARKLNFQYVVITAHPDNKPSNSVIKRSKANLVKTDLLEGYSRNIYILEL